MEPTKSFLRDEFGWECYGGHHLENRFTAFCHAYFLPKRFGIDCRNLGYSALVRSGQLDRNHALELLSCHPTCDPEIIGLVKKRLGFSDEKFEAVMSLPVKSWHEYKTYKPVFEKLEPLFRLMLKFNRVPESYYLKFCKQN